MRYPERQQAEVLKRIAGHAVVPVLRVPARDQALCAIEGILQAGLAIAEITLTIPGAVELIEELTAKYTGRLLLGAGTVLDKQSCKAAVEAGAGFIVSPAFVPGVMEEARRWGVLYVPGALTPTEIFHAWSSGAGLVKVFPASSLGGPGYIRALKGPFPQIELLVTGGVNHENAAEYLSAGALAVGVGDNIFPAEALRAGDSNSVAARASRFLTALSIGAERPHEI